MNQLSHYKSFGYNNVPSFKLTFISLMGFIALWVATAMFSLANAQTENTASGAPQMDLNRPILIVGDSLSSEYGIRRQTGWVQLLRQRLGQRYDNPPEVINASISGDTTSGGVSRLPKLLEQHQPGLVIVELGGNDALRGLSLDMTRENLTDMIERAQEAGALTILTGIQIPANYGPVYTEAFRTLYPEIADATGARLVPFLMAGLETDRNLFIEDGIHPSEQAQPILLDNVWAALEPALPEAEKAADQGTDQTANKTAGETADSDTSQAAVN
ncbi:MAG TPA: arylesterase [Orrella sp.]